MGNSGCARNVGSTRSGGIDAEVGNPGFDLLVDWRCIMTVRFTEHMVPGKRNKLQQSKPHRMMGIMILGKEEKAND